MVPREFVVPYLVANAVAVAILVCAFAWPRVVRWLWVAIFVWAATINMITAITTPSVYLVYGALTPSALYQDFIAGWFSRHIVTMVSSIAAGQAIIAMLLTRNDWRRRAGVLGAATFLLAIAPLGVGSAFPFSLTVIVSLLVMNRRLASASRGEPSPASTFVPKADVCDEHSIGVNAPAKVVFDVAKHADLLGHPVVSMLFRVRAWAMGDRPRPRRARGLVAETLSLGWGVLLFQADRTLVMGAVARPWAHDVTFSAVEPGQFSAFAEPDLVKIVWSLEAEPDGPAHTRFRTETRVVATDTVARRKFLRYWRLASPGIRLIRWVMLRSLRREAERQHQASVAHTRRVA